MTGVEVRAQSSTQLSLFGWGVLHVTGFDPTGGCWELPGSDRTDRFKFSSESTSVPEPGTPALLGRSLMGVGLVAVVRSTDATTDSTIDAVPKQAAASRLRQDQTSF